MTIDHINKTAALYLLKNGLATPNEITQLSGYTRQILHHWAKEFPEARAKTVKNEWNKALRFASKKL